MKRKLIFSLIFICFSSIVSAQVQKGKILIGGNISVYGQNTVSDDTTASYQDGKSFNLNIGPSIGIFLSDKIVVGVNLSYGMGSQSRFSLNDNNQKIKLENESRSFALGPYIRIYKLISGKLYFFAELQGSVGQEKITQDYFDEITNRVSQDDYINKKYSITAIPGVAFMATDKLGLELSFGGIGYTANSRISDNAFSRTTNTYSLNLNPFNLFFNSITLGGRLYLGGNE